MTDKKEIDDARAAAAVYLQRAEMAANVSETAKSYLDARFKAAQAAADEVARAAGEAREAAQAAEDVNTDADNTEAPLQVKTHADDAASAANEAVAAAKVVEDLVATTGQTIQRIRDWDIARDFLIYLGVLIGTTMVLAGAVLATLPKLYITTGTGSAWGLANPTLKPFYFEFMAFLALTIGCGAIAALVIFIIRTLWPRRPWSEWQKLSHNGAKIIIGACAVLALIPTLIGARTIYVVVHHFQLSWAQILP